MNKRVFGIVIGIVLIIAISILFHQYNEKNASYKIVVSIIEKDSPDRNITVYKNNKKIEFDSIYYLDDVLLCKGINPTINKFDVKDGEELKVKIKNKKEIKAKVLIEE